MSWDGLDELVAELRGAARGAVVLTGAGVSVASGIPSFRGDSGIWTRYDPAEYATIEAFDRDPARVWGFLKELADTLEATEPNAAHEALARLEQAGYVQAIVTQNVDGLHQAAGNDRVIELHGSHRTLSCRACGRTHTPDEVTLPPAVDVPGCVACGGVLKPDVVMFGEPLPTRALREAEHLAEHCSILLVVGTSAEVYPAAAIPDVATRAGAGLWEINPEPCLADARTVQGRAEDVLPVLANRLTRRDSLWKRLRPRRENRS